MHCIKTAEVIIEILLLLYRPIILVFRHQGPLHKSGHRLDVLFSVIDHRRCAVPTAEAGVGTPQRQAVAKDDISSTRKQAAAAVD